MAIGNIDKVADVLIPKQENFTMNVTSISLRRTEEGKSILNT